MSNPNVDIGLPFSMGHNNPDKAFTDVNEIRGLYFGTTIGARDAIPDDKRRLTSFAVIGTAAYTYSGSDLTDEEWTNPSKWHKISLDDLPSVFTGVSERSADFSANPLVYYLITTSSVPVEVTIPEWTTGNTDEYYFKLEAGIHKITITDGTNEWLIPTVGGSMHIKGSLSGWKAIHDNSGFSSYETATEDRDFSDGDGFENNTTYACSPSVSGEGRVFVLPPPKTYSNNRSIRASFSLIASGSLTIIRSDGGLIGGKTQQVITSIGSTITIKEADGMYIIVQDSRPSVESTISIPLYRLDDAADVGGFYALTNTKDDTRYGAESELVSPIVDGTTFINYASYITDVDLDLGIIPASVVRAIVSTRLTNAASVNFLGIRAYYEYAHADADGLNEVSIIDSSEFVITTNSYNQFPIDTEIPEVDLSGGRRFVVRVWLAEVSTDGTANSLTTKIEGDSGARFLRVVASSLARHNDFSGREDANCHPFKSSNVGEEVTTEVDLGFLSAGTEISASDNLLDLFKSLVSNNQYTISKYDVSSTDQLEAVLANASGSILVNLTDQIYFPSGTVTIKPSRITIQGEVLRMPYITTLVADESVATIDLFIQSTLRLDMEGTFRSNSVGGNINIYTSIIKNYNPNNPYSLTVDKANTGYLLLNYGDVDGINVFATNGATAVLNPEFPSSLKYRWYDKDSNYRLEGSASKEGTFEIVVKSRLIDSTTPDVIDLFPQAWTDKVVLFNLAPTIITGENLSATGFDTTFTVNQFYDETSALTYDLDLTESGILRPRDARLFENSQIDSSTYKEGVDSRLPIAADITHTINQSDAVTGLDIWVTTIYTGIIINF